MKVFIYQETQQVFTGFVIDEIQNVIIEFNFL